LQNRDNEVVKEESIPDQPLRVEKVGRNEPCLCGSGKKYKKCCG
jgi:preprotein translocase subunit SecA